eukprot:TRINITY_DN517_c0_g3_i1.p1 TRINITY_DN517_c0_g3~~TRINITY_DN517_c0_g3_i1.p1  ORF type:complete len:240 (+),score=34.55 TRINITY_DN517_c0_g3_i1:50-769(+)
MPRRYQTTYIEHQPKQRAEPSAPSVPLKDSRKRSLIVVASLVLLITAWILYQRWKNSVKLFQNCQALRVLSGDRIEVLYENRKLLVDLFCVDAPELGQKPYGRRARRALGRRVLNASDLTLHVHRMDENEAALAEIYHKGRNINLILVRRGLAAVSLPHCDQREYLRAEKRASSRKRGIWKKDGLHQEPWKYRRLKRKAKVNLPLYAEVRRENKTRAKRLARLKIKHRVSSKWRSAASD